MSQSNEPHTDTHPAPDVLESTQDSHQASFENLNHFKQEFVTTLDAHFSFEKFFQGNKKLILYFYPKDNTPGCTMQSLDLRNHYEHLQSLGADVVGVSRDGLKSHQNFAKKFDLPFHLLVDEQEILCQFFKVMKEKNMYGKKVRGIERSSFIYNTQGQLIKMWRGVKAGEHINDVIDFLQVEYSNSSR